MGTRADAGGGGAPWGRGVGRRGWRVVRACGAHLFWDVSCYFCSQAEKRHWHGNRGRRLHPHSICCEFLVIFKKLLFIFYFILFYLFIFRERGREGERKGEKHQCVVAFCMSPIGDLAHNPGMCTDWELNQRPFGSQARAQSTEPYQPGLKITF